MKIEIISEFLRMVLVSRLITLLIIFFFSVSVNPATPLAVFFRLTMSISVHFMLVQHDVKARSNKIDYSGVKLQFAGCHGT